MKNYMQMELGGTVRGLKFNIGTLKYLKEITGVDPVDYRAESNKMEDLIPFATRILHAALLSNLLSKKEDPDFTAEDVDAWVTDLTVADLTEVIHRYNEIFGVQKPSANGEVGADTQLAHV
jgi:hypothetical protein